MPLFCSTSKLSLVSWTMILMFVIADSSATDIGAETLQYRKVPNSGRTKNLATKEIISTLCDVRTIENESSYSKEFKDKLYQSPLGLTLSQQVDLESLKSQETIQQEQAKLGLQIECDQLEEIASVTFENLNNANLPGGSNRNLPDSQYICDNRLRRLQVLSGQKTVSRLSDRFIEHGDSMRNWISSSNFMRAYKQTCEDLLKSEQNFFNNTASRCIGRRKCKIFEQDLSYQWNLSFMKDCSSLKHDSEQTLFFKIKYLCRPVKEILATRTINFQDVSNSISCASGRLLYVSKVTLTVGHHKQDHDISRRPMSQDCDWQVINDYLEVNSENNHALPIVQDRSLIVNTASSEMNGLMRVQRGIVSENKCPVLSSISGSIFEMCQAQGGCTIVMKNYFTGLSRRFFCNRTEYDLCDTFAEVEYLCLREGKFSHNNIKRTLITSESTISETDGDIFITHNRPSHLLESVYATEYGFISLNQLRNQNRSNSGYGFMRKSMILPTLIYTLLCWTLVKVCFRMDSRNLVFD